jgi:hypothetical protein
MSNTTPSEGAPVHPDDEPPIASSLQRIIDEARRDEATLMRAVRDAEEREASTKRARRAWLRVADFKGDAIPEWRTGESFRRRDAELIVELGRVLRDDGWQADVEAIAPGDDAKQLAVGALRLAMNGQVNNVSAMLKVVEDTLVTLGLRADAWLREGLMYEVLKIPPPPGSRFAQSRESRLAAFAAFAEAAAALADAAEAYRARPHPADAPAARERSRPVEDVFDRAAALAEGCGWPTADLFNRGAVGHNLPMLAGRPEWAGRVQAHAEAARIMSKGAPRTLRELRTCLSAVCQDDRLLDELRRSVLDMGLLDDAARELTCNSFVTTAAEVDVLKNRIRVVRGLSEDAASDVDLSGVAELLQKPAARPDGATETPQPVRGSLAPDRRNDGRTPDERNAAVRQLIDEDRRARRRRSLRKLADALGCSPTAVHDTPAWDAEQGRRRAEDAATPKPPKAKQPRRLTPRMLRTIPTGEDPARTAERNEVWERLLGKCRTEEESQHLRSMPETKRNELIDTVLAQEGEQADGS